MVIHGKVDDTSHSTLFTLTDLGYGREDVIKCLMGLSVEEYSETRLDRDDMDPLFLYIFGKMINRKLVYIKLKIRESDRNQVVCVSFHYAKQNMTFPYA
ncbi:MAG: type II toxin-antitoxin system MqsR family toxin [Eubacterium sp.]|nr:type II toxin-antitoxin system MqsR family toxin [Eubacterium sp.]